MGEFRDIIEPHALDISQKFRHIDVTNRGFYLRTMSRDALQKPLVHLIGCKVAIRLCQPRNAKKDTDLVFG